MLRMCPIWLSLTSMVVLSMPTLAQDCQVGNLDEIVGSTLIGWTPLANLIPFDPAAECPECSDSLRITNVHTPEQVLGPCEERVRAFLWTADLTNPACPRPGIPLCAGELVTVTMPEAGIYWLDLPMDCAISTDQLCFLGFEIIEICPVGTRGFWTEIIGCTGYYSTLPGYNWEDVGRAYKIYADATCVPSTAVDEASHVAAASAFRLHPNQPNPFNPVTVIRYELPEPSAVSLAIYDAAGRLVRELVGGDEQAAGSHAVSWHGRDDGGREVASGVYLYRLTAGNVSETLTAVLIR
jgi:hypothetical protein